MADYDWTVKQGQTETLTITYEADLTGYEVRAQGRETFESTATPRDTMRPVTPARVSARPLFSPNQAMTVQSMDIETARLRMATRPSSR